jgi:hypothetical protein
MNLRAIRTIGLSIAIGTASILIAGPAGASPTPIGPFGPVTKKYSCAELNSAIAGLVTQQATADVRLVNANNEVARLDPLISEANTNAAGFDASYWRKLSFIQSLRDSGAKPAVIAAAEADATWLGAMAEQWILTLHRLSQELADAQSAQLTEQQRLTSLNAQIAQFDSLLTSNRCPRFVTLFFTEGAVVLRP